ncbi:glycosyltransferase family 10 domain-containing protein [Flavobacterium sp. ACAM 123]|uniref:glycosyltransferase family 10 domain-containing protein n=1 Tax=Flavobacterium sp. ACAM 123 TaxID=1189620 RepID=UPI0002F300B4|nr:glycosyltransferase family 10 [Flavobacterium sp. ACAM 123]
MKEIKINFVDFWPGFNKTNNYFYNLLIQKYKVSIDANPDLLFYSCYNNDYLNFDCTRIFYTAENIRPDFSACDFAFSYGYNAKINHFRLPLYSMYIDLLNMKDKIEATLSREEAQKIWKTKSKFCCMVVSNATGTKRLDFFKNLSKIKQVDSGGGIFNNIGGKVVDKLEFIKDYKFVISFENGQNDGYTTEKILEPIYKDCIPIYWGNKLVDKDFNSKRFLDYSKFECEKDLIDKLLEMELDDELAISMLMQPAFGENKRPHEEERAEVLRILGRIIENPEKPIARQLWKYIHLLKRKYRKNKKRIKRILN